MKFLVIPILLIAVIGGFFYVRGGGAVVPAWLQPTKTVQQVTTEGTEQPDPDAIYLNGHNVKNHPGAQLREYYQRFEPWLGEPIGGYDGRQQMFRMARLTVTPSNSLDWQIELDNLGRLDLMREGLNPEPGATPHPAVLAWLAAEIDKRTDVPRLIGRMISPPVCDRKHQCSQWSDKQRFLFDENATAAEHVARAPLGLWLSQPRTRPSEVPDSEASPIPNWLLPVAAVLVVGLFLRRGGGRGGRAQTI